MSKERLGEFENFLRQQEQEEWDQVARKLAPEIHEVDRQATRIWVACWPLKLTRLLEQATDLEVVIRDYRLNGQFRLAEQIDSSPSFLYGARFWPKVKADIVQQAASGDGLPKDLASVVSGSAERLASAAGTHSNLLLGISLVGHLMAAHVGIAALQALESQPANPAPFHKLSPEKVAQQRRQQSRGGWFPFLQGAGRKFKVRADPHARGGFEFKAFQGQDLSMAAKADTRDYRQVDPRRLEGAIPFECRSGSCGFCWIGVLSPTERLEEISSFEVRRLKYFGYLSENAPDEAHPPIRLSCQSLCGGDIQLVVPPWNGCLNGRTLENSKSEARSPN